MGIITGKAIPRRTFLRGVGVAAVGLPFLDAMAPAFAAPAKAPVRLAFLYAGDTTTVEQLATGWEDTAPSARACSA